MLFRSGRWETLPETAAAICDHDTPKLEAVSYTHLMEDPEFADFWQLLGYHDAITPEIQRAALAAEVFWPCEIYYHAPDVYKRQAGCVERTRQFPDQYD